jgi:hypothetical protein
VNPPDPIRIRLLELGLFNEDDEFPRRWSVQGVNVAGLELFAPSLPAALVSVAHAIGTMQILERCPIEIDVEYNDPEIDDQVYRAEFIPGPDRWFGLGRLLGLEPVLRIRSITNFGFE